METAPSPVDAALSLPVAVSPLPPWLAKVEHDPVYGWAIRAWRRAERVPGAWFDARKADAIVARWPKIFRLTNDRFAGVPFRLLPWQEIIVRLLVGWKRPIDVVDPLTHKPTQAMVRLFRRLDLWVPRKNGKSEFLAALGVLFFALEKLHGAEGYVFGRNFEQGEIAFRKMQAIIRQAEGLHTAADGTERIMLGQKVTYIRETMSGCHLLTGVPDGKHGRSATMILGDEIHEWTSRELSDTLRQSTGARLQPIELYASTAGRKTSLVGYEWFQESQGIAAGEIDDPTTLVALFAVDDDDDWQDEAVWRKANPSLGLTPTLDFLRSEAAKAKGKPAQEARFQAYHLNRWVDSISSWIPRAKWKACTTDAESWPRLYQAHKGRKAFVALDVSSTRDITALVIVLPPDEARPAWVVIPLFWVPEATLDDRAKEDKRVDWRRWVAIGALKTTPGDIVDQSVVELAMRQALADFDVQALGYDSWNASKLITDLQGPDKETGQPGMDAEQQVEMRQGHATLGEPTKSFERKVFAAEIEHGGHPVLAWMVGHAVVRFDQNLNYVPSKKDSRDKIDGVVATVMAIGLAEAEADDGFDGYLASLKGG